MQKLSNSSALFIFISDDKAKHTVRNTVTGIQNSSASFRRSMTRFCQKPFNQSIETLAVRVNRKAEANYQQTKAQQPVDCQCQAHSIIIAYTTHPIGADNNITTRHHRQYYLLFEPQLSYQSAISSIRVEIFGSRSDQMIGHLLLVRTCRGGSPPHRSSNNPVLPLNMFVCKFDTHMEHDMHMIIIPLDSGFPYQLTKTT